MKVVCFARSTHTIHELFPIHYSWRIRPKLPSQKLDELTDYFGIESDLLYIYTFSSTTTAQEIEDVLKTFIDDDTCEVLLLIADMKEMTKDVINHTRILMDESQIHFRKKHHKVMILLMHFPCSMFFRHCYPSLFLHGWEHYYLDTVGHPKTEHSIDIVKWFLHCCSSRSTDNVQQEIAVGKEDLNFVTNSVMEYWMSEIIPVISAYVYLEMSRWPHGESGDKLTRQKIWNKLVFEMNVKDVLMKQFLTYWELETITELSEKASNFTVTYESTLGMTGAIQSAVQSSFQDFVLYILSVVNKHKAIHALFLENRCLDETLSIFLEILALLPIPKTLQNLRAELISFTKPAKKKKKHNKQAPSFPFFKLIFKQIESILDACINDVHLQPDLTEEKSTEGDNIGVYLRKRVVSSLRPTATERLTTAMVQRLHLQVYIYIYI